MNSNKRPNEDDNHVSSSKHMKLECEVEENHSENKNASDCGSAECSNSFSQQKSDNGGAPEQAGPSENADNSSESIENQSCHQDKDLEEPLTENKTCGTLLFSGGTSWDLTGRKEKFSKCVNLWGPHRLSALKGIRVKYVASGNSACHSVIITEDGKVMTWGRNAKSQLGHGDTAAKDIPTVVEGLKDYSIVSAACGRGHTLFLDDKGSVYSCGDNKMGQCGVGSQNNTISTPTKVVFKGRPVIKICCGAEFSVVVDTKGGIYSFGLPEYGQLGHNSDGRFFITSNKMAFRCELVPRRIIAYIEKTREGHVTLVDDVQIVDVACGFNHCVAVDTKKRCFSWGFGGYGRLGHNEPKDEMVPRLIKAFDGPNRGVTCVYAGGSYSMAINEYDVLYFWGQNKKAGEATMYPKPVPDLVGWKVREVTCSNTSIVVIADESVISWGPSPTYGELCYGDHRSKSSTTPQEVKSLDGLHISKVACGYGHTLIIASDQTEADKTKLEQIPEFKP